MMTYGVNDRTREVFEAFQRKQQIEEFQKLMFTRGTHAVGMCCFIKPTRWQRFKWWLGGIWGRFKKTLRRRSNNENLEV